MDSGLAAVRCRAARRPGDGMLVVLGWLALLQCALAADFSIKSLDLTGKAQAQISTGFAIRTEERNSKFIGKLNLPGQEQFCEDKPVFPPRSAPGRSCITVAGNADYLALPGFAGLNNDNGNLNYDKGDLVSSSFRFAPRLQLTHPLFGVDLSAIAFYDPVNYDFTEYHPNNFEDNNGFQPRHTKRSQEGRREIGLGLRLLDAFVSTDVPLPGDRELSIKLGNQLLSLGTSSTLVLNGLNTVNPPDANLRFVPGSDIRDVFQRVPLGVVSTSLTEAASVLAFYQFQWKPVRVPPIGSFFSVSDIIGAGDPYIMLLNGKNREDPDNLVGEQERTQGNANLLSDAGRTVFLGKPNKPRDGGEYGFNFNYLAGWLNNTGFDFTYLNLHSRLPTISFLASAEGCTNRSTNQAEALASCQGFRLVPTGIEPLPIDTVRPFLDYARNIHSLGFSFSTNLGTVSWTGEVVYRPNQPLQVDAVDVGFAALQPTFPSNSLDFGVVTIPGDRVAIPDYLETVYRGNSNVLPGAYVRGYERFQTLTYNTSFLFLLGASDQPFGADQMIFFVELGAYQIIGLPSLDRLQIASPGTQFHHSAGVDGTGTPTPQQTEDAPDIRLNPRFQEGGFATSLSYGYRVLSQLTYENVLPNLRMAPQFSFFHDVGGRGPQPTAEFVEGRIQATAGINAVFDNALSTTLRYSWFFGGGLRNPLADRDSVQLSLSYDF